MKQLNFFYVCLILLFSGYNFAYAQVFEWGHGYGGTFDESGKSIATDNQGNTFIAGYFSSPTDFDPGTGVQLRDPGQSSDGYVLKLDKDGNFLWVGIIASIENTGYFDLEVKSIVVDPAGAVMITGVFWAQTDFDPGPESYLVSPFSYNYDTYFLKLNGDGSFAWVKHIGSEKSVKGQVESAGVVCDSKGNFYFTGTAAKTTDIDPGPNTYIVNAPSDSTFYSTFVLKLNPDGNTVWVYGLHGTNWHGPTSTAWAGAKYIAIDRYDCIYIAGVFRDSGDFDPGPGVRMLYNDSGEFYLQKIDSNANLIHVSNFFFKGSMDCFLKPDHYGNIFFTGGNYGQTIDGTNYYNSFYFGKDSIKIKSLGGTSSDIFVLKINAAFQLEWAFCVGGKSTERALSITMDKLNNIYYTGELLGGNSSFDPKRSYSDPNNKFKISATGSDAFVGKLSPYGDPLWVQQLRDKEDNANSQGYVKPITITVDEHYGVYVTGQFKGTVDLDPSAGKSNYSSTNPNAAGGDRQSFQFKWQDTCSRKTIATWNIIACGSYTVPSGDETYTQNGIYKDTIANHFGCDSLLTINLTIVNKRDTLNKNIMKCDFYRGPNGVNYYTSGKYEFKLANLTGCDTVLYVNLTIGNSTTVLDTSVCIRFKTPSGKYTYTLSGTYFDTIPKPNGCDSILKIYLIIQPVDITVIQNENVLTANESIATYQWLDCENGYSILNGNTSNSFTASENGTYAVSISKNDCTDTSECFIITGVGILKQSKNNIISYYPNPITDVITIKLNELFDDVNIEVINSIGSIVQKESFNKTNAVVFLVKGVPGLYHLRIQAGNWTSVIRIVKE